jgi:replicative DNA helicase
MSDLTESGTIEQIADVVALLFREDYYEREEKSNDIIEINFSKNRQGRTGIVKLKFIKETNTFYDLTY